MAKKYLSIYKKANPNNPDYYFFNACVLANKNMEKEALESLNKAVEFGYFDTSKLKAEKYFGKINKLTEFESIVAKAKINFEEF